MGECGVSKWVIGRAAHEGPRVTLLLQCTVSSPAAHGDGQIFCTTQLSSKKPTPPLCKPHTPREYQGGRYDSLPLEKKRWQAGRDIEDHGLSLPFFRVCGGSSMECMDDYIIRVIRSDQGDAYLNAGTHEAPPGDSDSDLDSDL